MIKNICILYFYARAIFNIVIISRNINFWIFLFKKIYKIFKYKDVITFFKSPMILLVHKLEFFFSFFNFCISKNYKVINFIKVLIENKKIIFFPKIISYFFLFKDFLEKIVNIRIITAYKISKIHFLNILYKIKKKFFFKIRYNIIVDKTLIGGICILINDKIFDISIKRNLNMLLNNFIN